VTVAGNAEPGSPPSHSRFPKSHTDAGRVFEITKPRYRGWREYESPVSREGVATVRELMALVGL
jgi:hypothetical protein